MLNICTLHFSMRKLIMFKSWSIWAFVESVLTNGSHLHFPEVPFKCGRQWHHNQVPDVSAGLRHYRASLHLKDWRAHILWPRGQLPTRRPLTTIQLERGGRWLGDATSVLHHGQREAHESHLCVTVLGGSIVVQRLWTMLMSTDAWSCELSQSMWIKAVFLLYVNCKSVYVNKNTYFAMCESSKSM